MKKQELSTLHHCVFSLNYHLVLVTKYRRKVITNEMRKRLNEIFEQTLSKWSCSLNEFNGESDHIHLLIAAHPNLDLSKLVNNLKTVSSRLIRKDFGDELNQTYSQPVFWNRTYCILSCGGAPLNVLKEYIQNQGGED